MTNPIKQSIRATCLGVREQLSFAYQQKASRKICERILKLEAYRYAKRLALYQAVKGEVDLSELWRSAPTQGKYCYFPALNDDFTLSFLPATPTSEFVNNRYKIPEPVISKQEAANTKTLDIIFIPLVAFDSYGTRLGMGAGYYDRTLATPHESLLIGVAYEFQRVPFIQPEPWDVTLDAVITEKNTDWFSHND